MKQFLFNDGDSRKHFMQTIGRDYMPAPIDEKNISTDWIDSLFDDGDYTWSGDEWGGSIQGIPVRVTTCANHATFTAAPGHDITPVLRHVGEVLGEGNDAADGLAAIYRLYPGTAARMEVAFYFTPEAPGA